MKKHPILYIFIGLIFLFVPTIIYLCFLVPEMSEQYNILMASGGVIGGFGFFGASKIPENTKYGSLLKLAANSFTTMTVLTLVNEFIMQIIGLACVIIVSLIIFLFLKGRYKDARRRKQNSELAEEVARSIVETTK